MVPGTMCNISIGTNSYLMEVQLPNGKRVASVAREQVRVPNGEMMLELEGSDGSC